MTDNGVLAVIELELSLLSPDVRSSPAQVEKLLEPDFREIGASGRLWTRSQVVLALTREVPDDKTAVVVTRDAGNDVRLGPHPADLCFNSGRASRPAQLAVAALGELLAARVPSGHPRVTLPTQVELDVVQLARSPRPGMESAAAGLGQVVATDSATARNSDPDTASSPAFTSGCT